MAQRPSMPPVGGQVQLHVVRVEAASDQVVKTVRALSRSYGGVGTHYAKGATRYCAGPDCRADWHRLDWYYRGYFAAEVYDPARKLWLPCVWELTEQSELDVRAQFRRGSVWQMAKQNTNKGKSAAATAKLYGNYREEDLPLEWDYRAVLMRLFHRCDIDLTTRNPMPPRLVLEPSPLGEGLQLADQVEQPDQVEHVAAAEHWRALRERQNGQKDPAAAPHVKNGRAGSH